MNNLYTWNTYSGWTPYDARLKEIEVYQHLVRHYTEISDVVTLQIVSSQLERLIEAQVFELQARLDAGLLDD